MKTFAPNHSAEQRHDSDLRLETLLTSLTVEEKVQLLTGRDFWSTWPMEKIGLRP